MGTRYGQASKECFDGCKDCFDGVLGVWRKCHDVKLGVDTGRNVENDMLSN